MSTWSAQEIRNHRAAAARLIRIKDEVFSYLGAAKDATEYSTHRFIMKKYEDNGLVSDYDLTIAAFGKNTANVHHFPGKKTAKRLKPGDLVMIDIWARLAKPRSPFADITWMGYRGDRIPVSMQKIFDLVKKARERSLKYIESELKQGRLPIGARVDAVARGLIAREGFGKRFLHNTGHILGFKSPHGDGGGFVRHNRHRIEKNIAYTIEPGIYLKDRFGVRSEIDFYVDDNMRLVVTTDIQDEIISI
jgi:Xaa-Pro aminopeptidase